MEQRKEQLIRSDACNGCALPLENLNQNQIFYHEGHPFCKQCYTEVQGLLAAEKEIQYCALCGLLLTCDAKEYKGKNYHAGCCKKILPLREVGEGAGVFVNEEISGMIYFVGYDEEQDLHWIQIHDMGGRHLCNGSSIMDKVCVAGFALTEEEYNWKDDEVELLNNLADRLWTSIPQDRLFQAFTVDKVTKGRERFALNPKCETMDQNLYLNYRRRCYALREGIPHLKAAEQVFVIYNRSLGPNFPTIDPHGNAWVFTKREYAEAIVQKNVNVDLQISEYAKEEFFGFVLSWEALGIRKFVLNVGTEDHAAEIQLEDLFPDREPIHYFQSELNFLLMRFIQNRANQAVEGAMAFAKTLWSVICHRLPDTVFLVPIEYENDDFADIPDDHIHLHAGSVDIFNRMALGAQLGTDLFAQSGERQFAIQFDGGPKIITGSIKFFGGENYEVGGATVAKQMHLRTLVNHRENMAMIPIFTDIRLIRNIYGEKIRVALWPYRDLVERAKEISVDLNKQIDGLVINPGSMSLELKHQDLQAIERESKTEVKFFAPTQTRENAPDRAVSPEKTRKTPKVLLGILIAALAIVLGIVLFTNSVDDTEERYESVEEREDVEQAPEQAEVSARKPTGVEAAIAMRDFLNGIDPNETIDGVYLYCSNTSGDVSPNTSLPQVFVTLVPEKANTPFWRYVDKKVEILEFLKKAELAEAVGVVCLIESDSGLSGASYPVEEVIEGYLNNTWTFQNAEADFAAQTAETESQ